MFNWIKQKLNLRSRAGNPVREDVLKKVMDSLSRLEKNQQELKAQLADGCWNIEKVIIERMDVDTIELNLETIDVQELSGMLSIGINYGGKQVKVESNNQEKEAGEKEEVKLEQTDKNLKKNKSPMFAQPMMREGQPRVNIKFS